jgi:pyridoxal phosphate enzyme (YggS family)
MIAAKTAAINRRITEAALRSGRTPEEVRLVAAAKNQEIDSVLEAISSGVKIIGHNYLQQAAKHHEEVRASGAKLHMIGNLQKNKASKAVQIFDCIETVDSIELADLLDRHAYSIGKKVEVMVQVNVGEEPQKSGVSQDEINSLIQHIRSLKHLKLIGLMTIPPFFDQPERARPFFRKLRECRDELMESALLEENMGELSMGMTGDFETAIEEGATLVRIGTAIFGPRL